MNLIRLFYVSKACGPLTKEVIVSILEKSRKNNQLLGLSGLLCAKGGYYAQILEGEAVHVFQTYIKIAQDPRHSDLVIVNIAPTSRRIFDGWAMGHFGEDLVSAISIDDILRFRDLSKEPPDFGVLMRRWLNLLETQPTSTSR